jgi:hypothetical protein
MRGRRGIGRDSGDRDGYKEERDKRKEEWIKRKVCTLISFVFSTQHFTL